MKVKVKDQILDEINALNIFKNHENKEFFSEFKMSVYIRGVEEAVVQLAKERKLRGPIHSYVGQEAIATGILAHATDEDGLTSTHRGHGHYISRGGNITKLIDELHGINTGCNAGNGGSMHVADLSLNHYGANGIVGGGVPIACGLALANKLNNNKSLIFCFFGDGASNQGVVLESFNLAAFLSLPLVLICENNQFAQSTKLEDVSVTNVVKKAEGFGIKAIEIDGLNIKEVFEKSAEIIKYSRSFQKPTLIQANTYRFHRHFVSERPKDIDYIDKKNHESLLKKDPIKSYCYNNEISINELNNYLEEIHNIIFNYSKNIA